MSELTKLFGKGKKVKLGDIEIEIKPLTVSSLPLMMQMGSEDKEKQAEAIKELIHTSLKDAVDDATDEEIDRIPIEHIMTIMEAVMEVNKLEEMDEAKKQFLEKLKK
jgi:hypothetical protein